MSRKVTSVSAKERREEIARLAATAGLASVEDLSASYGVTASTIRRDLAGLEAEGLLARTYGGAIFIPHEQEANLRQRQGESSQAKAAIARWAAGRIHEDETVLLDGGSTVGVLAGLLRSRTRLHIVAMGLNALSVLSGNEDIHLSSPGGRVRGSSQSFVGPGAESAIERVTFDRVFLGADGVTAEYGLCEASSEQTRLKELIAARASDVYVLADGSKIGRRPFHHWARISAPWTLVTDSSADSEALGRLRDKGVLVQVVDTQTAAPSNAR